ncbi:MAG: helix-hairpin-helix domain-containing protein [Acidobacteria bacterium]|nr:helix-hairpin-helix domain-containing protein [Acidobacteriota bacterium]
MPFRAAASLLAVSCLFGSATLLTARPAVQSNQQPPASAPSTQSAADEAGAALLVRMCNKCHDSARIVERRRTKGDWQDIILKMMEKGAEGDETEFETVFTYLCRRHGLIRVNDAGTEEMMTTMALTRAEAEAIAAYRTAHGPFADFAALAKVPEIDAAKLEKAKDGLVF